MTDENGPTVKTSKGTVRGLNADGVNSFKGVPFAKPPVDDLRFKPAQPAVPWGGEIDATGYGHAPIQGSNPLVENPTSEDCLNLNIFPPDSAGPHPVFVWIFGGNNNFGDASATLYDGTPFARDGVILVAINYRVSALGWLNLEHILGPDYKGSANAGISDMIAGIQWVHDEIEAFGGDPD
ncbi:MAG: carboxylesterase family protein, partial [Solirubrobacterales bacterium]